MTLDEIKDRLRWELGPDNLDPSKPGYDACWDQYVDAALAEAVAGVAAERDRAIAQTYCTICGRILDEAAEAAIRA